MPGNIRFFLREPSPEARRRFKVQHGPIAQVVRVPISAEDRRWLRIGRSKVYAVSTYRVHPSDLVERAIRVIANHQGLYVPPSADQVHEYLTQYGVKPDQ